MNLKTTVSGDAQERYMHELGAEPNIASHRPDFVVAVNAWSGGGVDLAVDTVGGETFKRSVYCVRHYGDLVTLLQPGHDLDWKEARLRNLRVGFELMLIPMLYGIAAAQEHQAEILRRCATLIDNGTLRVRLSKTFPLDKAAEAHRLLEAGGMTGKLALVMDE